MELTTRIFRDLADLANWAFQAAECDPGAYKLAEVSKNKGGKFNIDKYALQTLSLPECATWQDESEYIVKLSYNGGMQVYTFAIGNVFDLLAKFKKIATEDITAKEKSELCTLNKREKATGELMAVVEMPKSKTKQVAKAADKNKLRPQMCGVYVDNSGYIVASDGHILNACKVDGIFEPDFTGAILPTEFAKRADGCTVEIYKDGDTITAYCNDEKTECINGRFPNWRNVIDWNKVCKKCHVKIKFVDLKKVVGKDEAVTLLMCGGGMTVSTYNQYNAPDITERHTQIDAEHNITDFAISTNVDYIKKIMPCCNDMYVKSHVHAIVFVGDGCLSLIMPLDNQNLAYNDLTQGEKLISAFDIMNGVTVCNDTSKKDIAAEVATVTTVGNVTAEQTETDTDTGKETGKRTESGCTVIPITITCNIRQAIMQNVCERIAIPRRKRLEHLQHSGLFRSNTFRRLRVRRCFVVRWIVGRTYAENAAERKGTGKFPHWHGCKYRQFTRGSTWTHGMNGMTGGAISSRINKQYPGELYCRRA